LPLYQFHRFIYPYVKALVSYIKSRGPWVMMHSDGNLMGILDQILDIGPDILQSIDPMAGMDIRRVKQIAGKRMGLMGNVQCSLLQNGPDAAILDPLISLSHLAAVTSRVRLGTGIVILPQRNPVVLAKELASLDVVSGGRLLFGVGVGYLEPEFAAIGERYGRDHTTVLHAVRVVDARRACDPEVRRLVSALEEKL
jgi:hypothetical protein